MYGDELTIALDAYSILHTGMDQTGERFPLTFRMGAGRPPGYVYFTVPFIALFGPDELGVRGLSLFSGLGIIFLMYKLGKKLFASQNVGLWASFLTSISMWDIYLSRGGFEAHFATFLALFGVMCFLNKKYIFSAILFGLTVFTYPTFKLTLPILIVILTYFSGGMKLLKEKAFVYGGIILLLFALFSVRESMKGVSEERFLKLNVFSDVNLKEKFTQLTNEERTLSTIPSRLKPFLYNKELKYTRYIFEKYSENLSLEYLFLRGDKNPRHNPGEWGMLFLVELPLLVYGLYLLAKEDFRKLLFVVSWILIIPLGTMFMGQTHALRNAFMIPPFVLISSYAISKINLKWQIISIGLILIQFVFVMSSVYFFAPNKFGSFWSDKAKKESLDAILASKDNKVVLSTKQIDNIEYAYPLYAKVDPELVVSQYGKFPKVYGNVTITLD